MAIDSDAQLNQLHERMQQRANVARNPLETNPVSSANAPHGRIPNTPLASSTVAFILGTTFGIGLFATLVDELSRPRWLTSQVAFYLASWAFFHWAEFAVTAGWNFEKCSIDSYLLENGSMYHIAHGGALLEYLFTVSLWPSNKTYPYVSQIGILLVILGQLLRSAAMIHASTSFSHSVAFLKRDSHTLVTDGVYSWFRHPSYAGFFYWALGTQLVLQNPVAFVAFSIILWRFFSARIKAEEGALVRFFGNDYIQYRHRVGTKIPFIS